MAIFMILVSSATSSAYLSTITAAFQKQTAENTTVLPSLQKINNVLEKCTINEIALNIGSSSRSANQMTPRELEIEIMVDLILR